MNHRLPVIFIYCFRPDRLPATADLVRSADSDRPTATPATRGCRNPPAWNTQRPDNNKASAARHQPAASPTPDLAPDATNPPPQSP